MLKYVSMKSGTLSQWIACGQVKTTVSSRKMPVAFRPETRGKPSTVDTGRDILTDVRLLSMSRVLAAVAVVSLCVVVRASSDVEKFGKPLTLKETTKISDIYATPEKYQDKRVKVEGSILD